ncbi:MAG: zinc-binding dehydrogenase [Anaerolineae bacterium]|nr:zinc-binding dehydrogenase [Anaerolineae bacterium]MCB9132821.1 zinc-binding dehydrogenase [Anaerolineales bacterium]MCB0230501.1 zinc-binding dehydrogenase [Anaerolineae bacterium]MCB0240192.1 zinc-binding dehydrogenase [Anaerolineae bacterium]MCB0244273.1 zinc-binding dehydrogenase [Anaerolineae bacterium]
MIYHSVTATRLGPPEVLEVVENELRAPGPKEARIRVLASAVSRPDVTVRRGEALYSGTPLGKKPPFTPGYAVIGDVEAAGVQVTGVSAGDRVGVLTVTGGYTEVLYWRSDRLIPVPRTVDPAEAVTLILNYLVAWQTMHRSAKVRAGETALIVGASGGIGTALLQLGRLAGLRIYGVASAAKHWVVREFGATPIDYRSDDFAEVIRRAEPAGIDVVIDGTTRLDTIRKSLSLLRRGGRVVSYGEPASLGGLARILGTLARQKLARDGKSFTLYGTSSYFLGNRRPYEEDWATLFRLLETRQIEPVIMQRFPILEAARANELLESGAVVGNVVLVAPELLNGDASSS